MSYVVRVENIDRISVATIDNGKANVLGHDVLDGLDDALTDAEKRGPDEVGALVIAGREGMLTGGFLVSLLRSWLRGARGAD